MSTTDEARRYISWDSNDGPPSVEVKKAIQAHYRRFAYSRTESVTYPNGLRIECFWPDDGVAKAQAYFDGKKQKELARNNSEMDYGVSLSETPNH